MINGFLKGGSRFYISGGYNFVDVRDVASGLIAAAEKGKLGEGYLLCGEAVSLERLFAGLKAASGLKHTTFRLPYWMALPGAYVAEYVAVKRKQTPYFTPYSLQTLRSNHEVDLSKSAEELDYRPRPFEQSICDTVKWFRGEEVSPF